MLISNANLTQKELAMSQFLQVISRRTATILIAKNSFAKLQFRNSNSYFGWLTPNGFNGFGTYTFETGASFKGTFEGSLSKRLGRLTYTNLDVYQGEFLAGRPHGYGHYKSEKFKYSGYFQNGKFHGKGFLKSKAGEIEGIFHMGEIRSGEARNSSGVFNGTFENSAMENSGQFTFKNGNTYKGSWADNQFNGFGTYNWAKEEELTFLKVKTKYVGYWLNGKQHGLGILTFDWRSIICQWSCGKKRGAGIVIACNGSCFCGEQLFIDDQYNESYCIKNCQESRDILSEAINILTLNSEYESVNEKTNAFIDIVKRLVKEYSLFASPVNPVHLPDYEIPPGSFTSTQESKHLQQVLVENYNTFKNLYRKYARPTYECLNDFGLNLFYIDVFQKVRDINVLQCLKAGQLSICQSSFCLNANNDNSLMGLVSFYEFFQHFVHITEVLMQNEDLKSKANEMRPTFFGHLAIRVLLVLRMLETKESSLLLVREGIHVNLPNFIKLLDLLEQLFPGEKSLRTAFKFLKVNRILKGSGCEFFEIISRFYDVSNTSIDLCDENNELSDLEIAEIILRTCNYKLTNNIL